MRRAMRYRVAKFNRASTEIRFAILGVLRTCWYEVTRPQEMAAAREMIARDRAASEFHA